MPHLSLSLLGPFQATLDGRPITNFKSNKVRALLAYLAVEADRPHSRETLAGLLWPDYPDRSALDNLRYALSDLRRAIGDRRVMPPFLRITRDTLQFNTASDYDFDVRSFQQYLAAPSQSLEQLCAAINQYRGNFLEGFSLGDSTPFEEWALLKKEQLERQMLAALRTVAAGYERRGEFQNAEPYAHRQLDLAPWDEETRQQLMRIMALSGQRSSALAQYDVCRRALKQELGVEPSQATTQLYEDIRDGRFDATARRLTVLTSNEAARPGNIPTPLTSFVGRQDEVIDLQQLLAPSRGDTGVELSAGVRLLTLIGAGGCGKTRLAIQVAHDLAEADRFKQGVWWIDLSRLSDPALVPQTVATVFGLRESSATSLTAFITNYLRDQESLLVFDNCEHLIEACAQLINVLLSACPQLRILATSREAIGLTGELVHSVSSLALPSLDPNTSPEQLMQSDAIRLFVERAMTVAANWHFEAHASTVARICVRLDGIPLAIELAAARLKLLSIDQIATRLDDRFQLLTGGSRTALPRHQTLRATMDWSYSLLTGDERVLFRRLSVFAGSWTFEAAEAIVGQEVVLPDKVLDGLTHLVDKSLVVVTPQANEVRYRMLDSIREYAREKLIDAGEIETVRAHHLDFFTAFAERVAPVLQGTEQKRWLDRLETEDANLRAALAWSLDSGMAKIGLRLVIALGDYWWRRGHLREGSDWLRQALSAANKTSDPACADALNQLADLAWQQGNYEQANLFFEQGLALCRKLGDPQMTARALTVGGTIAHVQGDREQAGRLLEESLALFRKVGASGEWGMATALLWLADVRMRQGDNEQAALLSEESLALFRKLEDSWGIAFSLGNAGEIARRQGDPARAMVLFAEALKLHWESGEKEDMAYLLEALAIVAMAQGQLDRAARLWGAAEALRAAIHAPVPISYQNDYASFMEDARARLTQAVFAQAWTEGHSLTLKQAVEYALEQDLQTIN